MKKPEWIFVIILILIGAYFSYRYFAKPEKFVPLELVPKSAALVYETRDPLTIFSLLAKSDHWEDLKEIQSVESSSRVLNAIDSLVTQNNLKKRAFTNNPTLVSLHITGNESSGFMYFLPTGSGTRKILEKIVKNISENQSVQYKNREYEGVTLHQLQSLDLEISFINYKNYVVVSRFGYLVEDVVRNINAEFTDNFSSSNDELLEVPKLNDDDGNLYVNGELLTAYYNTMLPAMHPASNLLAKSIFMDINLTTDELFLSGFLFEEQNNLAGIFKPPEQG